MLLLLLIHILWFGRVSLLALAICQCFGRRDLKRCCSTLLSIYLAVELSSCLSPICLCLDASRSYRKKLRSFGRQGGKEEKLLGKEKQARPLNPPLLRCVVVLLRWLLLLLPLLPFPPPLFPSSPRSLSLRSLSSSASRLVGSSPRCLVLDMVIDDKLAEFVCTLIAGTNREIA